MKTKIRFLFWVSIVVLLPLAACGQFPSESVSTITVPTQTPYPTYTPYPTSTPYLTYTPDTLYTPYPTYTPFVPSVPAKITIDKFQKTFIIYFPGNYVLSKRDETDSSGLPTYDLVQVGEFPKADDPYFASQPPYFDRIQFETLESLQAFYEWCDQQALQGSPCFLNGDPDLINRYLGQKKAFENRENYQDYTIQKLGEQFYFTKIIGCGGGFCEFREYTTFLGNVKVVILVLLYPNQTEVQSKLSDKLFLSFYIEEAPQ
jgi:hypothetical protein